MFRSEACLETRNAVRVYQKTLPESGTAQIIQTPSRIEISGFYPYFNIFNGSHPHVCQLNHPRFQQVFMRHFFTVFSRGNGDLTEVVANDCGVFFFSAV
jgi:hypothetical protein